MSKRIGFTVNGEVQGVNYRSFAVKEAEKFGLTGYVQNESSGKVTGEAQGSSEALDDYVQQLKKGPSLAKVTGVDKSDLSEKSGETGFGTRG